MPHAIRLSAAALACTLLAAPPLHAQSKEPEVPAQPAKACTDRDRLTQGDTVETDGAAPAQENPSDKLARTDGVICPPPGLDPHIRAPAPGTGGSMPVIPPPGGGNSDVQPK